MRLTCEILSELLLQFNCLVKDFIGLLIRLPLIHFPVKDTKALSFTRSDWGYFIAKELK